MARPSVELDLTGPSGESERWTIRFAPIKHNHWGDTNWQQRVVTINSRMRNPFKIAMILLHEIIHVTAGQNISEDFVENLEENYALTVKALRNAGSLE
jgi:hypothetical protein